MTRDVVITGYGLLSPLGERSEDWWPLLQNPAAGLKRADAETFAPFTTHPVGDFDLASQVPRPGDQRAMGPMMQYGAYAAGLALEMAGLLGDETLLSETHMIAAAGGGERDWDLDEQIVNGITQTNDREAFLNQQLADGLRPTLFLAQLPNLFAGNISIIHKVSGSSRTFMGEEAAGVDAFRIAFRKAQAGQGDIFLVGAAFNAARPDLHLMYHSGGLLARDAWADLWARPDAGINLGSAGAFVVIETQESAMRRGAQPLASIAAVESGRVTRNTAQDAAVNASLQYEKIRSHVNGQPTAVLSGACGSGSITAAEREFLAGISDVHGEMAIRGTGQLLGHPVEAAFLQNVILSLDCLQRGEVFEPLSAGDIPASGNAEQNISRALVTQWGHLKGEAMAVLEKVDG